MKQDKVLSMLGMAKRAGKIQSGSFLAEQSVKTGRSRLVILAGDVSDNTRKLFRDKGSYRGIPVTEYATMEELGQSIGCGPRGVVSVEDPGFSKALISLLRDKDPPSG